jgi:nitrite reductase/ring-hydroxylating ferredoxin subunit/uncharacterized membrane protein
MSLRIARRLGDAAAVLDPIADALQSAVAQLPKPLRNALDGVWLGAPLHPALTDVPLGSWTAAAVFDAVDVGVSGQVGLAAAADAALAVGVLAAVPAAATGINDWSYLRGDSRRIGTAHALLNSTGLALNVASLAFRRSGHRGAGRAVSGLAYGIALVSAHLGGQLSFGLGVRVNRTAFESPEHEWQAVLAEEALDAELKRVEIDGEAALLTRAADGRICAIAARCSHLGGPLDEGRREGDTVTCPWHGSRFDLCSGDVLAGPAVFPQPSYEGRARDGRIELRPVPNT